MYDTLPLTFILVGCVLGALAVSSLMIISHIGEDAQRALQEAHEKHARRLIILTKKVS